MAPGLLLGTSDAKERGAKSLQKSHKKTMTSPECLYSLAESEQNDSTSTTKPAVLLLSGWTPGPLNYLRSKLQTEYECDVIEPNLLMPPWRGLWCLDINFILMGVVCLGIFMCLCMSIKGFHGFGGQGGSQALAILFLFCLLLFWIRLMVAVVTRSSIAHGVELCMKKMRTGNVVVIVGFSWGAGVLSELLTRDAGLDIHPACLLIAPVSATTAMAAMREDAAYRLRPLDSGELIHVVHASGDPIFCPHPERWESAPGVKNSTLQDIHVFKQSSSKRFLADLMASLFRLKTERGEP